MLTPDEQAKLQRSRQLVAHEDDVWAKEKDWMGMLYGIGLAIGGVFFIVGCIHIYLRVMG